MMPFARHAPVAFLPSLEDARAVVEDLAAVADAHEVGAADRALLSQTARDLTDLFQIVVLGEFNAGKSALLNALLGTDLLRVGAIPTTQMIEVIRYSDEPYERFISDTVLERGLPVPWLRDLSLVDTPGTNAILREHERITNAFVPRADLVLFVTSADRPFTETERAFLERIRDWGKKIVIAINKWDLLGETDRATVLEFVGTNAHELLDLDPPIYPVSARQAAADRAGSGVEALDTYIRETLSGPERLKLKLLNPIGVVLRLTSGYRPEAEGRLTLLREDVRTLGTIDATLEAVAEEVQRDVPLRLEAIDNVIFTLNERADRFFEEHVRLGRLPDLIRGDRIRRAFDEEVVSDVAPKIDAEVARIVEWLTAREERLWHDVDSLLEERRKAGDVGSRLTAGFGERRRAELRAVRESTSHIVATFDRDREAAELARSFQTAIAQTALAEVGAVSLGAIIAVAAGTVAADLTGIAAAGLLGGLALFILPRRREQSRKEFRKRTAELREKLALALREQIDRQLVEIREHLHQAIAPYRRFVEAERERVTDLSDRLTTIDARARILRKQIEANAER